MHSSRHVKICSRTHLRCVQNAVSQLWLYADADGIVVSEKAIHA